MTSLKPSPSVITYVFVPSPYTDINECSEAKMKGEDLCGINGTCKNTDGSYWCKCPRGYTNYGKERIPCSGECMQHKPISYSKPFWVKAADLTDGKCKY